MKLRTLFPCLCLQISVIMSASVVNAPVRTQPTRSNNTEDQQNYNMYDRIVTHEIQRKQMTLLSFLNGKLKKVLPIRRTILEMDALIKKKLKLKHDQPDKHTRVDAVYNSDRKMRGRTEDREEMEDKRARAKPGPGGVDKGTKGKVTWTSQPLSRSHRRSRLSRSSNVINRKRSLDKPNRNGVTLPSGLACSHVRNYHDHMWLLQVVKCPPSWTNETIRTKCESWERLRGKTYIEDITLLPVQDQRGTVYANVYCALCNRAPRIHPWEAAFNCKSNASLGNGLIFSIAQRIADFDLPIPDGCPRSVLPWKPEAITACEYYQTDMRWLFRSRHFASSTKLGDGSSFPVSFNLLLNFDFTGNTHLLFSAGQHVMQGEDHTTCRDSETYDTYSDRCRPITCGSSHRLESGQCVATDQVPRQPGPTMARPTTYAQVEDLPLLEDISIVTLTANISFGDYVVYFMKHRNNNTDLSGEMTDQITGSLNITADRISHFNVSFEFGSMAGSGIEVTKLTKEEYQRIAGKDRKPGLSDKSLVFSKPSLFESRDKSKQNSQSIPPDVESIKSPMNLLQSNDASKNGGFSVLPKDNKRQRWDSSSGERVAPKSAPKNPETLNHERRDVKDTISETHDIRDAFDPHNVPCSADNNNYVYGRKCKSSSQVDKSKKGSDINSELGFWRKVKITEEIFDGLANTASLNIQSAFVEKEKENGIETHAHILGPRGPNIGVPEEPAPQQGTYIFVPNSGANEEPFLLRSPIEDVVNQPMVMRISFVLVPSKDPNEQNSQTLAQKITQLVLERNLHLQLSGKNITIVDSDNKDESEIDESGENFCRWGKKYMVFDDEFSLVNTDNETILHVINTDTNHPVGEFDLWIMVSGNNMADQTNFTLFKQYAFVCLNPRIKQKECRRIELSKDEYVRINKNKSIIFEEKEYDVFSYEVLNETTGAVAICVPQSYDKYKHVRNLITIENGCGSEFLDVMRADGYLTLILGRLSAAALALVFITYCLFKNLRNLPGYNMMNLTFTLLIAQVIFTEGIVSSTPWLCITVAITEHFTRLAAQFWMNVISYDAYRTFSSPTGSSTQFRVNRRTILRYNLYAWGVPFLIVAICVFIDFSDYFHQINLNIGYGGTVGLRSTHPTLLDRPTPFNESLAYLSTDNTTIEFDNVTVALTAEDVNNTASNFRDLDLDVNSTSPNYKSLNLPYMKSTCWIGNPLANLVAFGAPIFIILIVNMVFFVRTIMSISKTKKPNNNMQSLDTPLKNNSTGRADVMLYIRMSSVMGLTWVFGFIWSIISSFAKVHTKTNCILVLTQGILSTIFNVSQGIFIFMAFVCNRRVLSLYRQLFARFRKVCLSKSPKARLYSVSSTVSGTNVSHQSAHTASSNASLVNIVNRNRNKL